MYPTKAWEKPSYRLAIGSAIEDLAGNRIGRAFEVDETSPVTVKIVTEDVYLPFTATPSRAHATFDRKKRQRRPCRRRYPLRIAFRARRAGSSPSSFRPQAVSPPGTAARA